MAIVTTINSASQFMDEFRACGRNDQFSYEGLEALYDYLEDLSDSIGENINLDVVGICCDYSEANIDDLNRWYSYLIDDEDFDTENLDSWKELLQDYTTVIEVNSETLIVGVF